VLFPPVVAPMAVIWKDSQMAAFLVAGVAAALSPRGRWRVVGWLLLGAAAAMRHNAAAAIVPLAMMILWEQREGSRLVRIALGLAAAIGVFLGATAVNHLLTDRPTYPWYNSLALHDLVGATRWSGEKSDAEMNHLLRDTGLVATTDTYWRMRRAYTTNGWWWLTHGPDRIWDPPPSKVQRLAIRRAWIDLVTSEPDGYWRHRRRMFNEVLGLSSRPLFSPVYRKFAEAPEQAAMLHERPSRSSFQSVIGKALTWLARGPLFRVYLYFFAGFALVILAGWKRQRLPLAFVASGLTYELTYFFLAPSPDFRYSHWMVTCVVGTLVVGATVAWRARATPEPEPEPVPA
jgi:hypothetical protein